MSVPVTSRIKILDTPVLAPGVCGLCGSAGDGKRKFIDFGKQLDWYGAVYLCSECIREAAQAVDYIPVASFNILHDELRATQIERDQLIKKLSKFSAVEDELRTLFESERNSAESDDDFSIDLSTLETPELSTVDSDIPAGGDTETNESTDIEGSDDLFDSSDFE